MISLLLVVLVCNCFGQIKFEKGYFITSDQQKINCLIKNSDWANTPQTFTYKISENSPYLNANIDSVVEFGFKDGLRFIKREVDFINSSDYPSFNRPISNQDFTKKKLFLSVLIEGKASLLGYTDGVKHFYLSMNNTSPQLLVYNKYSTEDHKIKENNQYKNQLFESLKCDSISLTDFKDLNYNSKSITKLIEKYNQCENSDYQIYSEKIKRNKIELIPKINFNTTSFKTSEPFDVHYDFGSKQNISAGLELEMPLPFNKNKFSGSLEAMFVKYNKVSDYVRNNQNVEIDYNAVQIRSGIKYYTYLSNSSKIQLGIYYLYSIPNHSNYRGFSLSSTSSYSFSLGYKLKNIYSAELKFSPSLNVLGFDGGGYSSSYNLISLQLGANIFELFKK